jgi:hypothetical protein
LLQKKYGQETQAYAAAVGAAAAFVLNAGSQIRFGDLHQANTNKSHTEAQKGDKQQQT